MSGLDAFAAYFDSVSCEYERVGEEALTAGIEVESDDGDEAVNMDVIVQSDRDEEGGEEQLAVYVNWPLKVPEDKLPLAAELVAKANFGVLVGCIDLDFDDGEVRAKTGIDVFNLTNEVCESMFQNSMNITMMYLPALQLMLAEDLTPDEALEQVEG